jgi:hypothetical protein
MFILNKTVIHLPILPTKNCRKRKNENYQIIRSKGGAIVARKSPSDCGSHVWLLLLEDSLSLALPSKQDQLRITLPSPDLYRRHCQIMNHTQWIMHIRNGSSNHESHTVIEVEPKLQIKID